jgi:ethanolamine utilization protein EutN
MLLGVVEGNAISTIKHPSMHGWKLLIVQPLDVAGKAEGDPILAIDRLGAGIGTRVVISNDGKGAREMVGSDNSPVRWAVIGIMDYERWQ